MPTLARSLEFDPAALDDLAWWVQQDRKKALRIIRLVQETSSDPFGGIGKPEPLKHELAAVGRSESMMSTDWCIKSPAMQFEFLRVDIITKDAMNSPGAVSLVVS